MKKVVITVFVFLFAFHIGATEDQIKFNDPKQAELYQELTKELRCPKCQNQNIADSNAVVAKDMRVKTKELVDMGQDKQQVIDYMVNRYGQFAHYQPPLNIATSLLWLLPMSFILFAFLMLMKRSRVRESGQTELPASDNSQLDKDLDALLNDKEGEPK